jgi:ZIP family zinc transporter
MLTDVHGEKAGVLYAIVAFFSGMFLIGVIDKLIPSEKNPHEVKFVESENEDIKKNKLKRMGVLTALAVAIHNFPEGLATFVAALQEPRVAIPIVAAIAIHNIPEGIAVSVPIYYATGSKKKAFLYSFASGLSEPIGALIGYLILMPFMNDTINGILYAAVAGIMVFISVDELLPSAREYGEHHLSIYGMIAGMVIMAMSLWLFI